MTIAVQYHDMLLSCMKLAKIRYLDSIIKNKIFQRIIFVFLVLPVMFLFQNCSHKNGQAEVIVDGQGSCTTLSCLALKYSLFSADFDGTNVSIVRTSGFQEMTHPRVANDKNWAAYTAYNNRDSQNCASLSIGYLNTEIRAVNMSSSVDKRVVGPTANQFTSNNYWLGTTNEFTYLSGPTSALKFYRSTVDSQMNIVGGPTQISVAGTIVPMDPQSNLASNKIVYPGLYNPGSGFVKSIFLMNLSDSASLVGLSLGRDHAGNQIVCADAACANIMENDPKISPDGTRVAFMRQAPSSGTNGFGWHIFVVPIASPLNEVDISYSYLGADTSKNDVLPEWVDNTTLIFSTIEIVSASDITKNVYTMKSDGTQRAKLTLPAGFRYSDVFPFVDSSGKKRMILSAEKIGATCTN